MEIQSDLEKGNNDSYFIHWLHIERDNMDLDEFESLALQSPRINDEMALVVGHLMARVRKELEKTFVRTYQDKTTSQFLPLRFFTPTEYKYFLEPLLIQYLLMMQLLRWSLHAPRRPEMRWP